jgi:hypothetical protein
MSVNEVMPFGSNGGGEHKRDSRNEAIFNELEIRDVALLDLREERLWRNLPYRFPPRRLIPNASPYLIPRKREKVCLRAEAHPTEGILNPSPNHERRESLFFCRLGN